MPEKLTASQIRKLAYDAGFRGSALDIAVAVALSESNGRPTAYNPEAAAGTAQGSGSRGLWQIYGTAHPQYNNDAVYDPAANARAAYAVYREAGGSFRPWSTYNNGSYKQWNLRTLYGNSPAVTKGNFTTQQVAIAGGHSLGRAVENGSSNSFSFDPLAPARPTIDAANKISAAITNPAIVKKVTTDFGFIIAGMILFFVGLVLLFYANRQNIAAAGQSALSVAAAVV